jgi:hypothetical protein
MKSFKWGSEKKKEWVWKDALIAWFPWDDCWNKNDTIKQSILKKLDTAMNQIEYNQANNSS